MTPRDEIRFNVLRSALYHTSRRLTFERWSRWCNFIVIMLGAAALSDLGKAMQWPWLSAVTGFLTAMVGAIQLVFDFGGKARDHQGLQHDYYHLLADIEMKPAANEDELAVFSAGVMRIAATEPPTYRAIDAKAYNDTVSGTGLATEDRRVIIPWHHRIFGQVWAFEGYQYKRISEVRQISVHPVQEEPGGT